MRSSIVGLLVVVGVGAGCSDEPRDDTSLPNASGSGGMSAASGGMNTARPGSGGANELVPGTGGDGASSATESGGQPGMIASDAGPIVDAGPSDAGPRTTAATGPADLPTACSFTLSGNATITVGGRMRTDIYMDPDAKHKPAPGGPMIFYWHATGTSSDEVLSVFGRDNIDKVVAMGGVVAAFESTPPPDAGLGTGNSVWFVEDFAIADEVLACAIRDANIDRKHIHALGLVPGALQTLTMQLNRANYMASVISYMGGLNPEFDHTNDATNTSSALLTFGPAVDWPFDLRAPIQRYHDEQVRNGRFVMLCNDSAEPAIDTNLVPLALRFFMDNGYKVASPYKGGHIPPEFPSYCTE